MSNKLTGITFYCNFNHGDNHLVRSLIRYVKDDFDLYDIKLKHPNGEKDLKDLNISLFWKPPKEKFDFRGYYKEYGILYFNYQVLAYNRKHFAKDSFTIITAYNIFNQTLKENFNSKLPGEIIDYLPSIDYSQYIIENTDLFTNWCDGDKKKVLICNNTPQSDQSININFEDIIGHLKVTFPDVLFFITNGSSHIGNNVMEAEMLVGSGSNLNEISYLSTKCDVIIGRYSGPHTFTYVKENLLNPDKTFITFCPSSPLYGKWPELWCDMGVSQLTDKHAKFVNIITDVQNKIDNVIRNI